MAASTKAPSVSSSHAAVMGTRLQTSDDRQQRLLWRQMMRRDFPDTGQVSIIVIPFCHHTGEIEEVQGEVAFVGFLLREHETDRNKTQITHVRMLSGVPAWAMIADQLKPHFVQKQLCMTAFVESQVYKDQKEGASSYIVVAIRRCNRGPPLLPCCAANDD